MTFEQLCENMDVDMLRELVDECNGWNGSLEAFYVYNFDEEFFEMFFNGNVIDAVRAVHFGNISNWNDEYIYFNAYGNLVSMSRYEREKMLEDNKKEIIETALELYQDNHLWLRNETAELFDEYLEEEEE